MTTELQYISILIFNIRIYCKIFEVGFEKITAHYENDIVSFYGLWNSESVTSIQYTLYDNFTRIRNISARNARDELITCIVHFANISIH